MCFNFLNQGPDHKKAFSLVETLIVVALFLIISGAGMGSYVQYYKASLLNSEVDHVLTLFRQSRSRALKNSSGSDYGVHLNIAQKTFTSFKGNVYNSDDPENKVLEVSELNLLEIGLAPVLGVTNDLIFENKTGKTQNAGYIILGNDDFNYTIQINEQGLVN